MVRRNYGEVMLHSTVRWGSLLAVLVSIAIWLGVSSIAANAMHILAKSNYEFRAFGSISGGVVAVAIGWAIAMSAWMNTGTGIATAKAHAIGLLVTAVWVIMLLILSALWDELLTGVGVWAVVVWVVELIVAAVLVPRLFAPSDTFGDRLQRVATVCAWLAAMKALILLFSPGISVRM